MKCGNQASDWQSDLGLGRNAGARGHETGRHTVVQSNCSIYLYEGDGDDYNNDNKNNTEDNDNYDTNNNNHNSDDKLNNNNRKRMFHIFVFGITNKNYWREEEKTLYYGYYLHTLKG